MDRDLKRDNAGYSLAELIVTFALMGIFLAAVAAVISSSVIIHSELTGAMYAQSVSETLLDKVTGELAAAKTTGSKAIVVGKVLKNGEDAGGGIFFYNKDGKKSCFIVEDGMLVMEGESAWRMDDRAYIGYRISEMQINRLNNENVFEVIIKVRNLKTDYEYTASRTIKSYNFKTQQDYEKIKEEDILWDIS